MAQGLRALMIGSFAVLANGCGSPAESMEDAGAMVPDLAVEPDLAMQVPEPYGRCVTNADCPAGLTCEQSYPGGSCTRSCSGSCPADGSCIAGRCYRSCTSGGFECGLGEMCDPSFYFPDTGCFASCAVSPTGGVPECNAGLRCDPYRGRCVVAPGSTGADTGEPCAQNADCRSRLCATPPTGFPGGACITYARQPDDAEYLKPGPMPIGRCPMGSVALPYPPDFGSGAGNVLICVHSCVADADCRREYFCDRKGHPDFPEHTTGGCTQINCAKGMACPQGTVCQPFTLGFSYCY